MWDTRCGNSNGHDATKKGRRLFNPLYEKSHCRLSAPRAAIRPVEALLVRISAN
jgi:hypothetical protein